jgi:hypothetical protein
MRKSELLLALALFGSVAVSTWLWNELRAERIRNAELSTRAPSLPMPVAATEPASPVPAPVAASPVAATPVNIAAPSPRAESKGQEDAESSQRRMLQQTQYREAWRAQQRLNYALRRENVIRLLGFTPEEADAVVEIAIDRQLSWMDRPQPKPMTQELAQQQQALYEQDKREDEAKLRELLGEEKRARFQEYMDSRPTRVQVDQLRPQFTGADTLRDDQVEPLIAALHVERTRLHTEQQEYRAAVTADAAPNMSPYSERELDLLKTAYERMHTAAAPILSGSQLKRLDALLKRDFDRQELEARMNSGTPDPDVANAD